MKFLSLIILLIGFFSSLGAQSDTMDRSVLYPLDTFTVKLTSESREYYLKTDVYAEVESEKAIPELKVKHKHLKQTVTNILSSTTPEEIRTSQGKTAIKNQMVQQLNKQLNCSPIKKVLFDNFVLL